MISSSVVAVAVAVAAVEEEQWRWNWREGRGLKEMVLWGWPLLVVRRKSEVPKFTNLDADDIGGR